MQGWNSSLWRYKWVEFLLLALYKYRKILKIQFRVRKLSGIRSDGKVVVMKTLLGIALLTCLAPAGELFAQSSNASVGGFVRDPSQAFIPGVTVTATNTQTGVTATVVSNESGSYTIQSLLPGTYRLTATLPGFRTHTISDVQLGSGVNARYNFVLEVGEVTSRVEVTAAANTLISESSSSICQVLSENTVRDLPLISNNVLDLMKTMAGVRGDGLGESTTFAGVSTALVNTVRDGLSVNEGRYTAGVGATTLVNPDMVGEFRVILAPVDAELGRGNGQIQILTRSGTNQFRGSAVWSVRNAGLDANTWSNNRQVVNGQWEPAPLDWVNRHQATVSFGGPIMRGKTFFFTLYDQQIERQRQTVRPVVLTACARRGIFRYWEGWDSGNIDTPVNKQGSNPIRPSVDSFGTPLPPATNPNDSAYNGQLRYFSVFGPLANTPTQPDCSDAQLAPGATPWDPRRPVADPMGISQKYIDLMPLPNIFDGGDGLNTAVHQWVRRGHNNGNFGLANGGNTDTDRKQINLKIDHNFNPRHKVAGNFSYEWLDGDYLPSLNVWPGGFTSQVIRRPRVLTVNFTSALTSTILNEARFGYRANQHVIWAPWEVTDPDRAAVPKSLLLQGGQGFPISYVPSAVGGVTANNFSCQTNCAQQGNITPLYDYADTISWTKGKHAFKGGFDIRYTYSRGSETPTAPIPRATGGTDAQNPNTAFQNTTNFPRMVTNAQTLANQLLYFHAGSVQQVFQYYFLQQSTDLTRWDNYMSVPGNRKITEPHQNDFSLFFKDDWKITPSLTLNLGIRYEYYGVPYEGNGLTIVPVGGGDAMFGVSGRSFDVWMRPDNPIDLNLLTQVEFVGPKTNQTDKSIYKKDRNNFGPALGFSWQVPIFGRPAQVRGGYQISYAGAGRLGNYSNFLFSNPGFLNQAFFRGDGSYFDTTDLPTVVPITPTSTPMGPVPLEKTGPTISAFDYNYKTPYIQNFTLSVTRDLSRKVNLDVRYVGTRSIGLLGILNLNTPNVYFNPALFDALVRTRNGEDVELFDQTFMGLTLLGAGTQAQAVNGTTQRGSRHLRESTTFRTNLANGNLVAIANTLNTFNGTAPSTVIGATTAEQGTVLRRANRGFNVPGGTTIAGAPEVPAGLFPENWIVVNPQFNQARYFSNTAKSNYHSMQAQVTLRPTAGLGLQGTYVWSRALEVPGVGVGGGLTSTDPVYTDPTQREKDYALAGNHVTHDFRSFGTFDLPIGPNKLFFANATGVLARIIEGWQTSFIVNMSSGTPASVSAENMLYGAGVADVVRPIDFDGSVTWNGQFGNYYGTNFVKVDDPQCNTIAASLQSLCTLQAVADAQTGEIVLQNPRPGNRGTIGRQTVELPGRWSFDAAMSKSLRISESKSMQIRLDATNILNHPGVGTPSLSINSANDFGSIQSKTNARREFRGQLRLQF